MHRLTNLILLLAMYASLALSSFSLLSLAQEPAPFEISVIPQAEYAVAGQPFTYTVMMTNVSQTSLKDVFIRAETPENTTFVGTSYGKVNWWVRKPDIGKFGEIFWVTLDPVSPGEVISFSLMVDVPFESEQNLINKDYGVAVGNPDNFVVSGPPITTQVVTPTPSPTPTVRPSPTPDILPTQSTSSSTTSQIEPKATTILLTSIITPTKVVVQKTSSTKDVMKSSASNISFSTRILAVSLGLMLALIIGLAWFFKHR